MVIEGGTYSAQVLEYDCSGDLKIKGGVFVNPADPPVRYAIFSSDRNKNDKGALADLLAEGVTFAYKDENNKETLVDVYSTAHTEEGKTVYVVSHNHGGFDENNKCECGYVCEHAVVNEDSMCTVCGKEMAAMVTKGDESHAYWTMCHIFMPFGKYKLPLSSLGPLKNAEGSACSAGRQAIPGRLPSHRILYRSRREICDCTPSTAL